MKRNDKTEKEKHLLRIKRTLDKIRYPAQKQYDDLYEWVPVEKPRFLGYEFILYYSDIDENVKGMKLAKYLLAKYPPRKFISNKIVRSLVSKSKNRYKTYKELVKDMASKGKLGKRKVSKYTYATTNDIVNNFVPSLKHEFSKSQYNNLPEELKIHFNRFTRLGWSGSEIEYYSLDTTKLLPSYLRITLRPYYSTHKGIPKSDKISEEKYLETILDQEQFYNKFYWGKDNWRRWDERMLSKKSRHVMKMQLKQIVNNEREIDDYENIRYK